MKLWKRDELSEKFNIFKDIFRNLRNIINDKDNEIVVFNGNLLTILEDLINYQNDEIFIETNEIILLKFNYERLLSELKEKNDIINSLREINKELKEKIYLNNQKIEDLKSHNIEKLEIINLINFEYIPSTPNQQEKLNYLSDNYYYGNIIYSSNQDSNTFDLIETREIDVNDEDKFICESEENYLECVICCTVAKNAQKCFKCQKLICTKCISSWLEKCDECPHCKTKPYQKLNLSGVEQSLISKVLINCFLCNSEKFEYKNMYNHYFTHHKILLYQCRLCYKKVEKINNAAINHNHECMIMCVFCENYFHKTDILNHVNYCLERIKCLICNDEYPIRFEKAHTEFYCRRSEFKK